MADKREEMNPQLKDVAIGCSWIPLTPAKPDSTKQQLICSNSQEKNIVEANGLAPEKFTQTNCSKSERLRNLVQETQCQTVPNANVSRGFNAGRDPEVEKWEKLSFGDLLATMNSGNSSMANQEHLLGAICGPELNNVTSNFRDGTSFSSGPFPDLNSPPGTTKDAASINTESSHFEPITPQKSTSKDREMEALHEKKNKSQLANHKLDKGGGTEEAEMTKTPRQKLRRKKHRPKVIIEGQQQPKRTPKPSPEKSPVTTKVKRKYVRRKGVDNSNSTPSEGDKIETPPDDTLNRKRKCTRKNETGESKTTVSEEGPTEKTMTFRYTRSLCRKSLNFDLEAQVVEESSSYSPISNPGPESQEGKKEMELEESVLTRAKCQIVFSDETHEKEANDVQVSINSSLEGIILPKSANDSPEKENRSFKRHADEAELCTVNASGAVSNSLQAYLSIFSQNSGTNYVNPGMYFPAIYKKLRSEKGHNNAAKASWQQSTMAAALGNHVKIEKNTSYTISFNSENNPGSYFAPDNNPSFGLWGLGPTTEWMKKKRSKGPTRARDLASFQEICNGNERGFEILHQQHTCMEALGVDVRSTFTTKKRSKRSVITNSTVQGPTNYRRMIPFDALIEKLHRLDLNADSSQSSSSREEIARFYQKQRALVPYQIGGALVPFDTSFDQVRRRKPRPKVELDDETSRVWRLLLENINSEGIDGTDEEKTKWWDEERRLFSGRADSFIARMHLVQGDRRFSPWKGSVLDSIVGVFLTQNVSDHLSSSAFMSLAAHFPIQPKSNPTELHEEKVDTNVTEPEVQNFDFDETSGSNREALNKPISGEYDKMLQEFEQNETRKTNSAKSSGNTLNGLKNLMEDGKEADDTLSSQNSTDSPIIAQDTEKNEASTLKDDPMAGVMPHGFDSTSSFVKLLQMAGSILREKENPQNETLKKSQISDSSAEVSGLSLSSEPESQVTFQKSPSADSSNDGQRGVFENQTIQDNNYKTEASNSQNSTIGSSSPNGSLKNREQNGNNPKSEGGRIGKGKEKIVDWDELRKKAQSGGKKREATANTANSVDWEAIRCADVNEIAQTIKERGMNNVLAERIKDFLNRLVRDHGSINLEWLRDVPPDKAKEYLLSVRGLGLKSVECVRLLTLHHLAFPVDTNVGRIAVRLGWVPLRPLPESLQLHLLEMYPVLESIQKYLWPRLCKLDQRTLYELHYQMITFGKVFCTKSKPNCNACPMRGECKHFASAFASARLALPAPEEKSIVTAATENEPPPHQNPVQNTIQLQLPPPEHNPTNSKYEFNDSEPIIEQPATPTPEPTIEDPATPGPSATQVPICDLESLLDEDPDEIPTIQLNMEEFTHNLQTILRNEGDMSRALVALTPEAASIPVPKLKNMSRLRTEHQVYELPDSHPLLEGMDPREADDPSPYLLAIWTPGETVNSIDPPKRKCTSEGSEKLCSDETCLSCNSTREANSQTVRGTLLIPCRTAMRGSFPLNGTYFQVNEVFSDHESSLNPMYIPREWLWNLPRRTVFFGTSIPTIFKGLTTEGIQYCFWRGFVCVRGFDRETRAPRPLAARLHFAISKLAKEKGKGKMDGN